MVRPVPVPRRSTLIVWAKVLSFSIRRIVAAGKVAGTLTSNADVAQFVDMGVRFCLTGVRGWLQSGAEEFTANARGGA